MMFGKKIKQRRSVDQILSVATSAITELEEAAEHEAMKAAGAQESIVALEIARQDALNEKARAEILASRFKALVSL